MTQVGLVQAVENGAVESRTLLAAHYRRYGNGPEFWDAYQRLLDSSIAPGAYRPEAANRLALLAQELGIVEHAQLV